MFMAPVMRERRDADRPMVGSPARRSAAPLHRAGGALSALEQTVVALSLFDHRSSIEPASGLARLLARLFGLRGPGVLANRRLEALRRFAVVVRLSGGVIPIEERARLLDAGFVEAALEQVALLIPSTGPEAHVVIAFRKD